MVADVNSSRVVPRVVSSQAQQLVFKARQTCSSVTSGFFPPKPLGLVGYEGHRQHAEDQMPQEAAVVAALVMAEAELAFAHAENMFHVPTPERHPQQFF